jgi:hypothetical protein
MPGNPSLSTGASDCIRKHFILTDQEVTIRAPSTAAAEGTTSDHPQRAVKTSDRHAKPGERKRGEKSQQERQRETRDGTTADQRKTVQNSAEAKKMYLAIMSKQAEVLLSRFVLVLIRLSTPLFSRGIQSTPTIRGSTRPARRNNSSETPKEQVSQRSTLKPPASSTTPRARREHRAIIGIIQEKRQSTTPGYK